MESNNIDLLKKNILDRYHKIMLGRDYRTIFLEEFTKELILNIDKIKIEKKFREEEIFGEISERLRKRIIEEIEREYEYNLMKERELEKISKKQVIPKPLPIIENVIKEQKEKPLKIKKEIKIAPSKRKDNFIGSTKNIISPFKKIEPIIQKKARIFNSSEEALKEIEKILKDPRVLIIECPGKDNFILVRTATNIMKTDIRLTEEQIREIIEKYSKESKIPLVNGILKVIKNNFIISGIISDISGSKFLIKKII
ncbi:MAG: hypothetical protein QW117_03390 [Candidatus Pacearchaeota archaeon]